MKNLLILTLAVTTLLGMGSCKKNVSSLSLPDHATVDSLLWFDHNVTNTFVYGDDGEKRIQFTPGEGMISVIKTGSLTKTNWQFTITKIDGSDDYLVVFHENGTSVNAGDGNPEGQYFPADMKWTNQSLRQFSITDLNGTYRLSRNGKQYNLVQVLGTHTSLMQWSFHVE